MTYNAPSSGTPDPLVLSTMTEDLTNCCLWGSVGGASGTWPTAATAYFYPVYLSQPRTYTKAWWLNGATAAGNVDVGIYTISGATATRVVASTAVAQAGVSAMQVAGTFTTTTIGPGLYYLGLSCSSASATLWRSSPPVYAMRTGHIFQSVTSHPLPSSASLVVVASAQIPVFGFSELTTV